MNNLDKGMKKYYFYLVIYFNIDITFVNICKLAITLTKIKRAAFLLQTEIYKRTLMGTEEKTTL